MDEVAGLQGVKHERLGTALRGFPTERIAPEEIEGAAQQCFERARRLGPREDRENQRMIRPDQAIMSCHIGHAPIAPAGTRTQCLGIGGEFLRPRH